MTVILREKIDQRDTKDPSDVVYLWSQGIPGLGKGLQQPYIGTIGIYPHDCDSWGDN